jgi:hypothetical protein
MADISLHGKLLKVRSEAAGFIFPRVKKGLIKQFTITSAEILALNATPISILAAPGAGLVNILRSIHILKPAGTAYAGVAVGEDLAIKYTDGSGSIAATLETTGFLDSASATRECGAGGAAADRRSHHRHLGADRLDRVRPVPVHAGPALAGRVSLVRQHQGDGQPTGRAPCC